ncbi:MAG: glycosyltransferase [Candidatus Peribacteraceae bacterium]
MIRVTIVIPVFNQECFVVSAIESALRQTYRHCSVLIVDDGSNDGTSEILHRYADRATIIRQENAGTSVAWNTAINGVNDELLVGLDSDDEFLPETVTEAVEAWEAHPDADIVYSDYEFIDAAGNRTKIVRNPDPLDPVRQLVSLHDRLGQKDNFLPFGHVRLYRRTKLLEIGGYDPQYLHAEDYDLALRLAERGAKFVHVPKVLYRYRWHQSNKGVTARKGQILDVRQSLVHFLERNPQYERRTT